MIESIATILHHMHDPLNTMKIQYIEDLGSHLIHVRVFRYDWNKTPQ